MNNRALKLACIFLLNLFAYPFNSYATNWPDLYIKAKPNIVVIAADGGICAGSYLGNGRILTAAHCVPYLFYAHVFWPDVPDKYENASIIAKDNKNDIAMLQINVNTPDGLKIRPKEKALNVFDEIYTIGHPGLRHLSFLHDEEHKLVVNTATLATISNLTKNSLRSTLIANKGSSGGPILDGENQVVGLVSKDEDHFTVGPNLNAITQFEEINKGKSVPLDGSSSNNAFDFYLWTATHSYLNKINKSARLDFFEFDVDYRNRFRVGLSGNGNSALQMGSMNLGYKFSIGESDHELRFLILGVEHTNYLLNPKKLEAEVYDFRSGNGAYLLINTGRGGIACKISVLGFDTGVETIAGLGIFF